MLLKLSQFNIVLSKMSLGSLALPKIPLYILKNIGARTRLLPIVRNFLIKMSCALTIVNPFKPGGGADADVTF